MQSIDWCQRKTNMEVVSLQPEISEFLLQEIGKLYLRYPHMFSYAGLGRPNPHWFEEYYSPSRSLHLCSIILFPV